MSTLYMPNSYRKQPTLKVIHTNEVKLLVKKFKDISQDTTVQIFYKLGVGDVNLLQLITISRVIHSIFEANTQLSHCILKI